MWANDPALASGSYKVAIYSGDKGPSAGAVSGLFTVHTDVTPSPSVIIVQPIAGDGYSVNGMIPVFWTQNYVSNSTVIHLYKVVSTGAAGEYTSPSIATVAQSNTFTISASAVTSAGQYYLDICDAALAKSLKGSCVKSDTFNVAAATTSVAPSLVVTNDSNSPVGGVVVMGSVGNNLGVFRFVNTSMTEDIKVTSLKVMDKTATGNGAAFMNLSAYNGPTLLGRATAPTPIVTSTDDNLNGYYYTFNFPTPIIVPRGNTISLTVKGDVASFASGAAKDNGVHTLQIIHPTDVSAFGATSNVMATVSASAYGGNYAVLRSTMTMSAASTGGSSHAQTAFDKLGTMTFMANTAGDVGLSRVTVTFNGNAVTQNLLNGATLRDPMGNNVAVNGVATPSINAGAGTVTWIFGNGSNPYVISGGSSITFSLSVDSSVISLPAGVTPMVTAAIQKSTDVIYADAISGNSTNGLSLSTGYFPAVINSVQYPESVTVVTSSISVSPASLKFTVSANTINNPLPASAQFVISNVPPGVTATIGKSYVSPASDPSWGPQGWLTVSAPSPVTGSAGLTTQAITLSTQPWNAKGGLANGTYTASVAINAGGKTISVPVTLVVTPSVPVPVLAPVVNISASPVSLTLGSSTKLTWSSTNATSCTISGAGFNASAMSGSQAITPTTSGIVTYAITCKNSAGVSASKSVTVMVSTITAASTTKTTTIVPPVATTTKPQTSATSTNNQTAIAGQPVQNILNKLGSFLKSL